MGDERLDDLLASLKKAAAALRDADVPFAVGGGFAVWVRGGPGRDHDVDLLVKEADAERALAVLEDAGFKGERPPEGWLLKAWDGDVLVDLIFRPSGFEVTDEVLSRCAELSFQALTAPALPVEDVMVSKLLSMTEHAMDYEGVLEVARSLREQVDWAGVRARTAQSPFARAFFTLAEGLDLVARPSESA
ncbi:MAG: hypothetical protein QOI20_387 [Acidimicrobiaceae bacterium]|nr:hypothetical protein [Acidimicrobiaceae bacterium]